MLMCVAEVNAYLSDPEAYVAAAKKACDHSARVNLEAIVDCLTTSRCTSFDECIEHSRKHVCLPLPTPCALLLHRCTARYVTAGQTGLSGDCGMWLAGNAVVAITKACHISSVGPVAQM